MAKIKKPVNPFYVALVLIGIVFSVTACAYFVMTLKALKPAEMAEGETEAGGGLNRYLSDHGFQLMMIELACLAVTTIAAMALDEIRDRRAKKAESSPTPTQPQAKEGSAG